MYALILTLSSGVPVEGECYRAIVCDGVRVVTVQMCKWDGTGRGVMVHVLYASGRGVYLGGV